MSPLRTLRQLVAPTGRHRSTPPERIEVRLSGLHCPQLPKPRFPEAAYGACVPQAFRHCTPCGGDVPVVVHPSDAHTCGAGHLTLPPTTEDQ